MREQRAPDESRDLPIILARNARRDKARSCQPHAEVEHGEIAHDDPAYREHAEAFGSKSVNERRNSEYCNDQRNNQTEQIPRCVTSQLG